MHELWIEGMILDEDTTCFQSSLPRHTRCNFIHYFREFPRNHT